VSKRVRDDIALALALQPVVSDCTSCPQRFFNIAGLENALLLCVMCPNPSQKISLEFESD
jgi:hypothetical protein